MGEVGEDPANRGEIVVSDVTVKVGDGRVGAREALDRLKESEASEWLAASPALVECAKQASEVLFSLTAKSFEKAPLSKLYTDRFDAEQIWQQIDLQSHPILSYIRRKLRKLEKSSNDEFFTGLKENASKINDSGETGHKDLLGGKSGSDKDGASEDGSDDDEMGDAEAALDSTDEEEEVDEGGRGTNGVEDDFLRIRDMEKFLDRADAEGVFGTGGENMPSLFSGYDEEEDDDEEDGEDFEAGAKDEDEDEGKGLGFGKYEEFFGKSKKKPKAKPSHQDEKITEGSGDELPENDAGTISAQLESKSAQAEKLSTHERRQDKIEKRMKQLEKASLDPKDWTQQGEVTAKKRPTNSALEVELDFEHNARPPPVITEEITTSLEDIIRARIAEGRFDDVQRKTAAPVSAPRERIELDESKSQKGLGEIYEADYMQKTGLAVAPTSTSAALKEEATGLFKALCSRLDALSHFHFAPKPVIEDMEVRADIPALAMEEVAPLAVSEASMLAPEEIFTGEHVLKGEGELTPEERKRRRAQKKRKRKSEKKTQEADRIRKKIRPIGSVRIEPKTTPGLRHSNYSKSSKVFAQLDEAKIIKGKAPPKKGDRQIDKPLHASFLKL